jgi:hypothetical protein
LAWGEHRAELSFREVQASVRDLHIHMNLGLAAVVEDGMNLGVRKDLAYRDYSPLAEVGNLEVALFPFLALPLHLLPSHPLLLDPSVVRDH